jgi:hypothetical protein
MDKARMGKTIPNVSEWLTKIPAPVLRAPRPMLNILNHVGWCLSSTPCIILPKPLNITLIATDNKINNIPDATLGDIKAIIANTNATVPRPMFVRRVVFVIPNDWFDDEEDGSGSSNRPVDTLSIPMVSNVIESSVIVVFTGRIGYSIAIIHIDNVSDITPLPICKERNHAGGGGRLLLITTGVMKLSIHSDVEILFVCYRTLI